MSDHPQTAPAVPLPPGLRRLVTSGVLLGMFLAALEATVVGTAMPTVVASLGGLAHYSWVFTAYMLTSTATVPVWGRLSDLCGRRRVYLAGMAVFLVGSALAGAARSMSALVAFRAIQGLGAGALVPLALTIIGEIYTLGERSRMQGVFSSVWGLASIIGPLAGGYLTDTFSWRWIFYINLPIGIVAALVIARSYPDRPESAGVRVDWTGAALLFGAVAALVAGLSGTAGARWLWLAAAAAAAAAFVHAERLVPEPILPLELLRDRRLSMLIVAAFLVGMAIFGALAFIPLFVQGAMGATATEAGTVLTPLMLGWVLMSIAAARLLPRVGYRRTMLAGVVVMVAAFVLLTRAGPGTQRTWLLADVALLGSGTGLASLSLLLVIQHSVPRERLGLATSLNLFARSIGGAAGVAVMGAILAAGLGAEAGTGAATGAAAGSAMSGPAMPRAAGSAASTAAPPRHHVPAVADPGAAGRAAASPQALLDSPTSATREAREAFAGAVRPVFGTAAAVAGLALLTGLWLPPFDPSPHRAAAATGGNRPPASDGR